MWTHDTLLMKIYATFYTVVWIYLDLSAFSLTYAAIIQQNDKAQYYFMRRFTPFNE